MPPPATSHHHPRPRTLTPEASAVQRADDERPDMTHHLPAPGRRRATAWLATLGLSAAGAHAQAPATTPTPTPALTAGNARPLRLILPMAAGSVGDTLARQLSLPLSKAQGRPVVVENLPGTGGMTGTAQLVRAPADGSALALVSSSHVINPFIYATMPYDALKDVTPITVLGKSMMALVVHPSLPAQGLAEFVALLKAQPGKLNYGSSGNGGVTHLPAELLNREAGLRSQHIPYKGLAPQVSDTIGGQVAYSFVPVGVAAGHVKAGKLRALAVTGSHRSPLLPQVPTVAEAGYSGAVYEPWLAIIAPAGLPAGQVRALQAELRTALQLPELQALMDTLDMSPVPLAPEAVPAFFQSELARYGALVKFAGAKIE